MVVPQNTGISRDTLISLRQNLIGDQNAKFTFYRDNRSLIREVIDYNGHDICLKLDVLLILAHLDKGSCRELGKHGTEMYLRMLAMTMPEDSAVEAVAKYVKLRRICIENCTDAETNERFFFQEMYYHEPLTYFKLAAEQLIQSEEAIHRDIVLDYMRLLSNLPFVMTSQELIVVLKDVLNFYVDKYLPSVNFKYAVVTSVKTTYEQEAEASVESRYVSNELNSQPRSVATSDAAQGGPTFTNEKIQPFESLPQHLEVSDPYDLQLIFIISSLLTVFQSGGSGQFSFLTDMRVNIFYASLIRHPDIRLKTSALSFFYCQLGDSWFSENRGDFTSSADLNLPFPIKLWLPTLISTLNEPELPQFFSPLAILSSLATEFTISHKPENIVIDTFFDSNLLNGMIDTFLRLLSLNKQNTDKLQLLSDYLKFFSEVIGKDERCRLLFLENNAVLQYMENAFSSHLLVLNNFREDWTQLRRMGPLPPLFDAEFVTNWAKCLKACSRSVGVLRTSLKRNKLADFTLKLAREIYEIVSLTYSDEVPHFLSQELVLLGELLGAMSNFVVEFSSLRTLMKKNGIIALIKHIFSNPVFNTECLENFNGSENLLRNNAVTQFHNEADIYPQILVIQTNSLWVLRHLIYNSETCDKIELLSQISLESILQFANSTEPNVLNQCFQLLRNLTCNSRKVINMLLDTYDSIQQENKVNMLDSQSDTADGTKTTFLKFLAFKLKTVLNDPSYYSDSKIAEALLYIVVNFTAINENKRNLVIEQEGLLEVVKDFILVHRGDEITKACLWIITNLIWDSSIQHAPYNGMLPENNNPHFENDWSLHEGSTSSAADEVDQGRDSGNLSELSSRETSPDADPAGEFTRRPDSPKIMPQVSPALVRFKKLDKLGFNDAVKRILDWNGDLDLKERAKSLLYQMESLRKTSLAPTAAVP